VYLRLWLGIIVVAEISLLGWIASAAETASPRLFWLAAAAAILLAFGVFLLHRQINRHMDAIGRL